MQQELQKIVASEITIVDSNGKPRMRLLVDEDNTAAVQFFDKTEQLRMALYLREPVGDDVDLLCDEPGSDNEAGLIVTARQSHAALRLGVLEDGLFGKRPHLEIVEGLGYSKRRHRFPPRPPNVSD